MRRLAFQSARSVVHSSGPPKKQVFMVASLSQNMNNSTENEVSSSPSDTATVSNPDVTDGDQKSTPELPKLSPTEFRRYNHIAETMEMFHNHFRQQWNQLYSSCQPASPNDTQSKTSASRTISMGLSFISHLTMHHNIEEEHIFPLLGQRMPAFAHGGPSVSGPIQQHREIHAGLDKLEVYLKACKRGEKDFRREEVKLILDGFGEVLWKHLEDEVWELGAERMRKYWTLEEIRMFPL